MSRSMDWQPGLDDCTSLLRVAFPDLVLDDISVLGEGWDSVAFLVNGNLVFHLPKREDVARRLERERTLLELISDQLLVTVPRCTLAAQNLPGFPPSVGGYPAILGTPLNKTTVLPGLKDILAKDIAGFLRALHGIDLDTVPEGVLEPLTSDQWWQNQWDLFIDALPVIERSLAASTTQAIRLCWEQKLASSRATSFQPALIHGDLAAEHILVDEKGYLGGIIDFSDAGLGDPALDLAGLPESLAESLLHLYTDDSAKRDCLETRRRFYRLAVPFHALRAGRELDRPDLIEAGLAGIRERFRACFNGT